MKLRAILTNLARVVAEEAEKNPEFGARVSAALGNSISDSKKPVRANVQPSDRPKNRRSAALLDPVAIIRNGEPELRSELEKLGIEQLKDIVAEFGMDPGKLVMKWTTESKIVDRIVEVAASRAVKGHAFRKPAPGSTDRS